MLQIFLHIFATVIQIQVKIDHYIKELLFTNQGVVIPGFGGFVTEYEPAAFDVNENKFLPPSKKVIFKPDFNYKDNLLVDFIAKKTKIEKEEAEKLIDEFVKDLNYRLNKGSVELPDIGTLSKSGNNIQFNQAKDTNLLADSFGLQSVKTEPVKQTSKQFVAEQKPKKTNKKLIILALSSVAFIILAVSGWFLTDGYTSFNLFDTNKKTDQQAKLTNEEINKARLDSIARADSIKAMINESIDENTDLKEALFYKEPAKQDTKPRYSAFHIVAGSFKSLPNAEKFLEELKSKGYDPKIIQSGDTLYRITIYSFTDETEALKKLYKIRQNSDIKSVWILKSI